MIENIISSEIVINTKDPKNLKKILELEMKRKKYKRSDTDILIYNQNLKIVIKAKDFIAFKATLSNYLKILELVKKTYEVEL